MQQTNIDRLQKFFKLRGIDAALLSSPWTLTWLTGYAPPVQVGPSPFDGGPAVAWWHDGQTTLICSDGEAGTARSGGAEVVEYAGYTIDRPLDVVERQVAALREVIGAGSGRNTRVAVEYRFLTAPLVVAMQQALPEANLVSIDREIEPLRAVKTPGEIARMREVLALCDRSQADVKTLIQAGVSEIALWGELKAGLEVEAGSRLPVHADLVGGARTGDMGGYPAEYVLKEGDPVIADIVPRLNGYWGDICGTHFVGAAPADMARTWRDVHEVLLRAMELVRPGLKANDLDARMRDAVRNAGHEPYPHHSGHGLGTSFHEEPRLVPYNEMALEAGMIVALEPGVYFPGRWGVRLENVVLVTEGGCELLTRHLAI